MLGKILDFSFQSGEGTITTEQGQRYVFSHSEWKQQEPPLRGQDVDFDVNEAGQAVQVYLALAQSTPPAATETTQVDKPSHQWVAIVSLVLGILTVAALFDDGVWDTDMILGMFILGGGGLTCGIVTLANKFAGKGMAIAGVVMSSVALLGTLGVLAG